MYQLLKENSLKSMLGETALVPMLVDGDNLISFCTLAPVDDIQPTDLSPWITKQIFLTEQLTVRIG